MERSCSDKPAVIASMSARVGSIGDNSIGGWHSSRASKSALNQLHQCMSIEFARKKLDIACILLHPGTVDTDLSKPFQKVLHPRTPPLVKSSIYFIIIPIMFQVPLCNTCECNEQSRTVFICTLNIGHCSA